MQGYSQENYKPYCRFCDGEDFLREREYQERQYLVLEDGEALIDSDDMDNTGDWVYLCVRCSASAVDLEDLLQDNNEWED